MKNKYISIFASVALAVGASSCVDLDTAPLDQKSDATFWVSATDAEQAVSNLYAYLPTVDTAWDDIYTDNATSGIKWLPDNRAQGLWYPEDFHWYTEYAYIRRVNLVFAHIDEIEEITANEKNNILGQAYFFRALIYSNLIRQFGDVPYLTEPLELADADGITRTDWKTVYDNVMAEFDKAVDLLPLTTNDGRINKNIALGYKARTALYFANPDCQHYVSNGYQVAADCAKSIINSGVYSLYGGDYTGTAADFDPDDYASMFWDLNLNSSKEGMLVVNNISSANSGTYFLALCSFPVVGWGGTNPTQEFVDCFEDVEGAPIATSKLYDPLKPNENRDPRLVANVLFPGDFWWGEEIQSSPLPSSGVRALYPSGGSPGRDATTTGYYTKKWLDPDVYDLWDHNCAFAAMRYTEVLLTYAEALNEISPLDAEAFSAVNKVRARVGMPALQNSDASKPTYCATQDDLRQRIRNEWRIEFFSEGDKRQWDVRRWNIAMEALNNPRHGFAYTIRQDEANAKPDDGGQVCDYYVGTPIIHTDSEQSLGYAPHNYVFPVPQDDIDLNKNLTQNPGY